MRWWSGAGAVGLAVARELALRGLETIVLEAGPGIGNGTSSRNSEVIHAGLYDAPGSLKATLCVAGREALYPYCETRGVGHRRCGKLVVAATPAQVESLRSIAARATANGVRGLRWLSGAEARELEPALQGEAALLSTVTGIIDSHALMLALPGRSRECRRRGRPARAGRGRRRRARRLRRSRRRCRTRRAARRRVRQRHRPACPGAGAAHRRSRSGTGTARLVRQGQLLRARRRSPFTRLIYPVPEPGGLGVHLTLDLAGQARFGPDVEWLDVASPDAIDYAVDPARAAPFYAAVRRYWPGLEDDALVPAYSGVRPKLQGPGAPASDFMLQGPQAHGVPRPDEPVRHRVAGADGEPGDRRGGRGAARRLILTRPCRPRAPPSSSPPRPHPNRSGIRARRGTRSGFRPGRSPDGRWHRPPPWPRRRAACE